MAVALCYIYSLSSVGFDKAMFSGKITKVMQAHLRGHDLTDSIVWGAFRQEVSQITESVFYF